MSMPGFTAEAALDRSNVRFHMERLPEAPRLGRNVTPQLRCDCGPYTGADGQMHLACYCF